MKNTVNNSSFSLPESLNSIFDKAAVVLILVNKDGRILHANRSAIKMIGKDQDNILNLLGGEVFNCINAWSDGKMVCGTNQDCSHCIVRSNVMNTFQTKKETYKAEGTLSIHVDENRLDLTILVSTAILEIEKQEVVLLTIDDITNQKKLEKELKTSEQRLKKAQEIAQVGHWEFDIVNNKLSWSDEIYRLFNIHPQEFKATYEAFLDTIHPEDREMVNKAYSSSIENRTPYEIEHRLLLASGKIKYVLEKCQTDYDESGNPKLSIGTIHDITEIKEKEIQLQEAITTKNKLFSIIAHDLKGPFNVLLGFSDLLVKHHRDNDHEQNDKIIKAINNSANTVYNLLNNLLAWSRSQSGKMKISSETIYLKDILPEQINIFRKQADEKNIRILTDISDNHYVYADINMLTTILRNLISNAVKFTRKGGIVTISTNKTTSNDTLKLSVRDTGVGIPEEKINNLFEITENTTTSGTANEKGSGLGLVICKDFVQLHGGKLWAESKIDQGSTFHFTLPIADSH